MPRFYCEYCDVYLKCASQGCRKEHNFGRKHINNKIDYYTSLIREKSLAPPIHNPPLWLVHRMQKRLAKNFSFGQAGLPVPQPAVLPPVARPAEQLPMPTGPIGAPIVPAAMAAVPGQGTSIPGIGQIPLASTAASMQQMMATMQSQISAGGPMGQMMQAGNMIRPPAMPMLPPGILPGMVPLPKAPPPS